MSNKPPYKKAPDSAYQTGSPKSKSNLRGSIKKSIKNIQEPSHSALKPNKQNNK